MARGPRPNKYEEHTCASRRYFIPRGGRSAGIRGARHAGNREWAREEPLTLYLGTGCRLLFNRGFFMSAKRKIEIFGAGCSACDDTVALIRRMACSSCEIEVLDMHDPAVAARAKSYGVHTVPAVAVDGRLAACYAGSGPDEASLRAAGVGVPLL